MRDAPAPVVPMRPLTVGELLDAAFTVLRAYARPMLATGVVLAFAEAALLYPLRSYALADPADYFGDQPHDIGWYLLLLAAGLGTECAAIALLGGLATRAVTAGLLPEDRRPIGRGLRSLLTGPGARTGPLLVLALLALVVGTAGALLLGVGWLAWWMFAGLSAPALVLDMRLRPAQPPVTPHRAGPALVPLGPVRAVLRSIRLVGAARLRPAGVRVLGYLAWAVIRVALGAASAGALSDVVSAPTAQTWITLGIWVLVNAVAYPALGCLDAVTHVEARIRSEGLDIALAQARRTGAPLEPVLAVPS